MIVRTLDDGSVILVNQTDHAKLSGFLAAHWGNGEFARVRPYESAVRAAMFHDVGWYKYETGPRVDAQGKPMAFMHVPLNDETLANFQWATDWMNEIDPYAALLMRKHRNGLWQARYDAITHPAGFNNRNMNDLLRAFVDRNEDALRRDEAKVDRAEFAINYQLLQVFDLLSLYFCTQAPKDDYIEPVPRGYSGEGTVRMTLRPLDQTRVAISPYPFARPTLPMGLVYRHLPQATFASDEAFRRAYFEAPLLTMPFEFVAAR
jgi:hypothetical protein